VPIEGAQINRAPQTAGGAGEHSPAAVTKQKQPAGNPMTLGNVRKLGLPIASAAIFLITVIGERRAT
jgi:hypothetical protein